MKPVRTFQAKAMSLSKRLFILGLSSIVLLSSSFKPDLGPARLDKASPLKRAVPFKGKLTVMLGPIVTGTGVASHLGRFTYESVDDASNFPSITGTSTLTAANGDQLFTTFSGTLDDGENGLLQVNFENIITGGTGRFAGASGSFVSSGSANPLTGTASTTLTGIISY